ncbi:MAG TPA: ATP-binding protein [Vicinamibacterales bacterium]|nr:ATP-binding protein [Vicinamibacterales bacterium]
MPPLEDKFGALLEAAPDAMLIVEPAGRIVLANAQAERMFGYERHELIGREIEILVPPRYRPSHVAHRAVYGASAHARPMGAGLDLYGVRKNGTEFPVEISLSPLETEQGPLVASAIRDITERRAAEAERTRLVQERAAHAEANRIKDEFLATLSHELRTPLNAVLGWTGLLKAGALDRRGAARALDTIERNARMQAQLIEDLLDVSRMLSGQLKLDTCAFDLAETVDAAVAALGPAAFAKRLTLQASIETRPLLTIGDPERLQQVLWNLVSNAVKFTPEGGRVDVRLARSEKAADITVRDSGIGIRPAFLPHVFDRFRQSDSSTTRSHGGLGLGLAIARTLVELHGGTIEVFSAGENQGTTFRVSLPAVRTAVATPREATEPPALTGTRILVVDDQPDEQALISMILSTAGAEVRTAGSVAEALNTIATWTPQVIVSDLAMPIEDGYTLIRKIRSLETDLARVPALALTAHARPEDRQQALSAGFQSYLAKPVRAEDLLARAAALVAHANARRRET